MPEIGAIGRGEDMPRSPPIWKAAVTSELSGNVIDLCPVGALTFRPLRLQRPPVGAEEDPDH